MTDYSAAIDAAYENQLLLDQEDENRRLNNSLDQAMGADPEKAAKVARLNVETELPSPTIERNLEEVDIKFKRKQIDAADIRSNAPTTAQMMENDAYFAKQIADEIDGVTNFEKSLRYGADLVRSAGAGAIEFAGMTAEGYGRLLQAGERMTARGLDAMLPEAAMDLVRTPLPEDMEWILNAFPSNSLRGGGAAIKELGEFVKPDDQDYVQKVVGGVGQMAAQIAGMLVNPAAGVAMLFGQGVDQQGEMQEEAGVEGSSIETDIALATGGAVTATLEKIGLDKILKRIPPKIKNGILRNLADLSIAGGIEALEETVEGIMHNLIAYASYDPDNDLFSGLKEEASVAFGVGVLMRGLINTITFSGRRSAANAAKERFEGLSDRAKMIELRTRNPDAFKAWIAQVAEDSGSDTVYVDTEQLGVLLQSEAIPDDLAETATIQKMLVDVRLAEESGESRVEVPLADWMTEVAGHEFEGQLMRHAAMDRDSLTPAQQDDTDIKAKVKELAEMDSAQLASEDAVYNDVLGQLLGLKYDRSTSESQALLYAATFRTFGERTGRNPKEIYDDYGLNIERSMDPRVRERRDRIGRFELMIDRLRTGDFPKTQDMFGRSLVQTIIDKGGIAQDESDIAAMDPDERKVGRNRLMRADGRSLDDLLPALSDEGWLATDENGKADVAELMEKIDQELRGEPVYLESEQNTEQVDIQRELMDLEEALAGIGVSLDEYTNEQIVELFEQSYDEAILNQAIKLGYKGNSFREAVEWVEASKAGLDLSEEARLERAIELGFDITKVWYHGTDVTFDEFDPRESMDVGIHFGSSEAASKRVDQIGLEKEYGFRYDNGKSQPNIIPVFLRETSPLRLTESGKLLRGGWKASDIMIKIREELEAGNGDVRAWLTADEIDAFEMEGSLDLDELAEYFDNYDGENAVVTEWLQSKGFDSIRYDNQYEGGGESIAILDPVDIRSIHAAFNPSQVESAKLLAQKGWHGTIHSFDAFSLKAIGTGEGFQAYGWGLYFAGRRSIGEFYRDEAERRAKLDGRQNKIVTIDGKEIPKEVAPASDPNGTPHRNKLYIAAMKLYGVERQGPDDDHELSYQDLVDIQRDYAAEVRARQVQGFGKGAEVREEIADLMQEMLDSGAKVEITEPTVDGNLVEVNIPEPDEILDREALIGKQSEKIIAALENSWVGREYPLESAEYDKGFRGMTGAQLYYELISAPWLLIDEFTPVGYETRIETKKAESWIMADQVRYQIFDTSTGEKVGEHRGDMWGAYENAGFREDQIASLYLDSLGIKGLRYKDDSSRRRSQFYFSGTPFKFETNGAMFSDDKKVAKQLDTLFDHLRKHKDLERTNKKVESATFSPATKSIWKRMKFEEEPVFQNYVVWDESVINIEAVNDQRLQAEGLSDAEKAGFDSDQIFYHGTNGMDASVGITEFNPDFRGFGMGAIGTWFDESPSGYDMFMDMGNPMFGSKGAGGHVYPVYLKKHTAAETLTLRNTQQDVERLKATRIERDALDKKYRGRDESYMQELQQQVFDDLGLTAMRNQGIPDTEAYDAGVTKAQAILKKANDEIMAANQKSRELAQEREQILQRDPFFQLAEIIRKDLGLDAEVSISAEDAKRWRETTKYKRIVFENTMIDNVAEPRSWAIVTDNTHIRSVFAKFDANRLDSADILAQPAKTKPEGKNVITGDLTRVNPAARKAVYAVLERMPKRESKRILDQLNKHKSTNWAALTVKGLVYRDMIYRAENDLPFDGLDTNEVWNNQSMANTKILNSIRAGGPAISRLLASYEFIGTNEKAEQHVSTSFANCAPSKACAQFCYATRVSGRPSETAKAEFTEWALRYHLEEVADNIAGDYLTMNGGKYGNALRLNDKGDLSPLQIDLIHALNKRGIRMQIFSKQPALLRKVDDFNLKMLSIDDSNMEVARRNTDLLIAYTITPNTTEAFLAEINDRVAVYLPVTLNGKSIGVKELKQRYPNIFPAMRKSLCPVDARGMKTVKDSSFVEITAGKYGKHVWNCQSCDLTGATGCFNGVRKTSIARQMLAARAARMDRETSTKQAKAELKRSLDQMRARGDIDDGIYESLSKSINAGVGDIWKESDTSSEIVESETDLEASQRKAESGERTRRDSAIAKAARRSGIIATDAANDDDVLYQSPTVSDIGLYSNVEATVISTNIPAWTPSKKNPLGEANATEVWNKIKNSQGVKKEEVKWMGLEEFLSMRADNNEKVTRDEVLAYVQSEGVVVEEILANQSAAFDNTLDWTEPSMESPSDSDIRDEAMNLAENIASDDSFFDLDDQYEWLAVESDQVLDWYLENDHLTDAEHTAFVENGDTTIDEIEQFLIKKIDIASIPDDLMASEESPLYAEAVDRATDPARLLLETTAQWSTWSSELPDGSGLRILGNDQDGWEILRTGHRRDGFAEVQNPDNEIFSLNEAYVQADLWLANAGFEEATEQHVTQWHNHRISGMGFDGGGKNYREQKLVLPDIRDKFVGGHFPNTPNVLAHLRVSERILNNSPEALVTYFLEELQSDWHSSEAGGRLKGYRDPDFDRTKRDRRREAINREMYEISYKYFLKMAEMNNQVAPKGLNDLSRAIIISGPEGSVPLTIKRSDLHGLWELLFTDFQRHVEGTIHHTHSTLADLFEAAPDRGLPKLADAKAKWLKDSLQQIESLNDPEINYERIRALQSEKYDIRRELIEHDDKVPDAPFKGDAWLELAMKRAIVSAVEDGVQQFAWPNAAAQNLQWGDQYNYESQYDKKMPSLVKKLTGIEPVLYNSNTGEPITEPDSFRYPEYDIEWDEDENGYVLIDENSEHYRYSDGELYVSNNESFGRDPDEEVDEEANQRFRFAASQKILELQKDYEDQWADSRKTGFWAIPITDELKAEVEQNGFPLFQKGRGPRGQFNPNTMTITLTPNADLSTFLHESMHFFHVVMKDLAKSDDGIRQDVNTLREWAKGQGAKTDVEIEEMIASGYEAYLREGKAPVPELQGLYTRFGQWLINVYNNAAQIFKSNNLAGAQLSDEVRQVMDRLVATQSAIDTAREQQSYGPFPYEALGLSPDQARELQAMSQEAAEDDERALTAQVMREIKRSTQAWWKAGVKEKTERILDEQSSQQIYQVRDHLSGDSLMDGIPALKLSSAELRNIFGLQASRKLMRMSARDGQPAQAVAQLMGYGTAEDLVMDLINSQTKAERRAQAKVNAEEEMRAEHGDMMTDGKLAEEANQIVHSDKQADLMLRELAYLNRVSGKKQTPRQYFKAAAEMNISQMRLRDIRPDKYRRDEAKARNEAMRLTTQGDFKGASLAMHKALRQFYLFKAASAAAKREQQGYKYSRSLLSGAKFRRIQKAGDFYLDQLRAVLDLVEIRKRSNKDLDRLKSMAEWHDQMLSSNELGDPRTDDPVLTKVEKQVKDAQDQEDAHDIGADFSAVDEILRSRSAKNYREYTLEEFEAILDTLKHIEHMAKLKTTLIADSKKRELDAAVTDLVGSIEEFSTASGDGRKRIGNVKTGFEDSKDKAKSIYDLVRTPTSLIRMLDGYRENGIAWQLLMQPLQDGSAVETDELRKANERMEEIFSRYSKVELQTMNIPKYNMRLKLVLSKHDAISMLLNWGTETNRLRVLDGFGIDEATALDVMDTYLDQKDYEFVKDMIAFAGSFKEAAFSLHRDLYGFTPEEVKPMAFQTKYGLMEGGYWPIRYNTTKSAKAEEFQLTKEEGAISQPLRAQKKVSSTFSRVDRVFMELETDFTKVLQSHISEVIHKSATQRQLFDIGRILSDNRVKQAIQNTHGEHVYSQIVSMVRNIKDGTERINDGYDWLAMNLRDNATLAMLGFSVRTMALQPFGVTNSIVKARMLKAPLLQGYRKYYRNPITETARIKEKSLYMTNRERVMTVAINRIRNKLKKRGKTAKVREWAMTPIMKTQFYTVDAPLWIAVYDSGIENGLDEKQAVDRADQSVRDAQGGGDIVDTAEAMQGAPWRKMFTNFLTYMVTTWNIQVENYARYQDKEIDHDFLDFMSNTFLLMTMPAILMALFNDWIQGEDDDQDLVERFAREQASFLMSTNPITAQMTGAVTGWAYTGPQGTALFGKVANLGIQAEQGEFDKGMAKALIWVGGLTLGLPAAQINRTLFGGLDAAEQEAGVYQTSKQLLFGEER